MFFDGFNVLYVTMCCLRGVINDNNNNNYKGSPVPLVRYITSSVGCRALMSWTSSQHVLMLLLHHKGTTAQNKAMSYFPIILTIYQQVSKYRGK